MRRWGLSFANIGGDLRMPLLRLHRPALEDYTMSAPLPPYWSEEIDDKGRTYYSNHRTRETVWQRPVAHDAAAVSEQLPTYGSHVHAPHQHTGVNQPAPGASPSGPCCTPKLTFWLSCALGWIVWAFAVAVSVDNAWITDLSFYEYAALDEELLDSCESSESSTDFCEFYKAFSAMQVIAVIVVSVAMVVQMIAIFRPASDRCCSVKALALAGGILMAAFAFFQMLAFILVIAIEKELDEGTWYDAKLGPTFGVAVVACLMGMVQAAAVLTFARSAGNGPAYKCCYDCMSANQDPNRAAVKGGSDPHYQQQQPPTQQQAPPTVAFGTNPP